MLRTISFLIYILCFVLVLPRYFYNTLGTGLDNSWQISLELALKEGLIFGRDFIFTYGPLGNLTSRLPFEASKLKYIFSDLFLYSTLAYALFITWSWSRSIWSALLALFCFYILGTAMFYVELPMFLLLFSIFFIFCYQKTLRFHFLIISLINATFALYVKLNTGLIALIIVIGVSLLTNLSQKKYKGTIIVFCVSILIVFLSTFLLPVDLKNYIIASAHIANGYNDAMYLDQPDKSHYVFWALGTLGIFILVSLVSIRTLFNSVNSLILIFSITLCLFVVFKQGFVRADEHVFAFFEFTPILFGMWAFFADEKIKGRTCFVALAACVISVMAKNPYFSWSLPLEKFDGFANYQKQYLEVTTIDKAPLEIPVGAKLPPSFIEKIANGSVDIIPEEISIAFYNNLKYRPRPVMQSYSAYDSYLDGLGETKYISSQAPDFIIFSPNCIDDRYCFFDETKIKLALLKWYEVHDFSDNRILLKKITEPKHQENIIFNPIQVKIGKRIKIPESDHLLLLSANLNYSFLGKIVRAFYKPPALNIRFKTEDGWSRKYRIIIPILKGGVIINKFISSIEDAKKIFNKDLKSLTKVSEIKITSASPWAYNYDFESTFREVIIK